MPESICQLTSARKALSSIDSSARKGVTIAVPQPVVSIIGECIPTGRGCALQGDDVGDVGGMGGAEEHGLPNVV